MTLKSKLRHAKRATATLYSNARILLRRALQRQGICRLSDEAPAFSLASPGLHTFFGYYDVSPFHADGSRILACRVPSSDKVTPTTYPMQLGYYTTETPRQFFAFSTTDTWCWQQGARLQWAPSFGADAVLFNSRCPKRHCAAGYVCLARTGEVLAAYDMPVYSLHSPTGMALSLDFARLQRLRPGYGYAGIPEIAPHDDMPAGDGIYLMRGPGGRAQLIFSLKQAALLEPTPSMLGATHYFNHLFWSPSGARFMVIHAWHSKTTGKHTRILTMTPDGTDARVLTRFDRASHYWWLTETELLVYGALADTNCYFHISDTPSAEPAPLLKLPAGDGHPSLSPAGGWLLGDTLPDELSERRLWLYDQQSTKVRAIGALFSPLSLRGEIRCDLHPRWDATGTRIAIDSAHSGTREMLILNVQSIVTPRHSGLSECSPDRGFHD